MFGIDDAIGGVTNLASSVISGIMGNKQRKKAAGAWDDYIKQAKGQMSLDPTKSLEFLGLQDKSALESMDPAAKNASMEALGQLVKRGAGSGLDVQSREALQQGMRQSGAAARAARQSVLQDYQARGTGGSGAELAAALGGSQQAYGDLANATGQASAAAEQRRLEANVLASRAGQQQQQLGQQQAQATDALRRFNAGARQNVLGQQQSAMQNMATGYGGKSSALAGTAQANQASLNNMGQAAAGVAGGAAQALFGKNKNQYGDGGGIGAETWGGTGQAYGPGF